MENAVITSEKLDIKRILIIAIAAALILVIALSIPTILQYSKYKKAQDFAILSLKATTSEFNYNQSRSKLVEDIYSRLTSGRGGVSYRDVDDSLGKAIYLAGYSDFYRMGSAFFMYNGFIDYLSANNLLALILYFVYLIAVIGVLIFYFTDKKKSIAVYEDRIVCQKYDGKVLEFMLRDVTSIETTGFKGLLIQGNGIKHKNVLISNNEEIKDKIIALLPSVKPEIITPVSAAPAIPQSNADELKKFKELLDSGIITQEEFDTKKKQLLGL